MSNKINFETYLFINKKKFIIYVINNTSLEKIYSEEVLFKNNYEKLNYNELNQFLEKNIFKIEKILGDFIKNIYLILDSDEFFPVKFSIKKNNNGNYINSEALLHPLNDLKNLFQSNFVNKKIIHILIENYFIDNENYLSLPQNLRCKYFSLDVNFICLPNNFIEDLAAILKKYHILLNQIFCADYVENFIDQNHQNIFTTANRIKSGLNENEVLLVSKSDKNKGFFERFFDLFN